MLYLVTWEYVETGPALPAEKVSGMLRGAILPSLAMLSEMEGKGKLRGGVRAGERGSAMILEASSNDDVSAVLHSLPFYSLMKFTVVPLQSFASRLKEEEAGAKMFEELHRAGKLPW